MIFMKACCILASSNLAANSFRSNWSVHVTGSGRAFCWKNSTARCRSRFRFPAVCVRTSFSWRLNVPRSLAISAALEADFSTSISDSRHGWFGSILLSTSEVWPRMLVRALLKSSATVRANCSAQSSFCLSARPVSPPAVLASGPAAALSRSNWSTKYF